jgi:hypothetical protein
MVRAAHRGGLKGGLKTAGKRGPMYLYQALHIEIIQQKAGE